MIDDSIFNSVDPAKTVLVDALSYLRNPPQGYFFTSWPAFKELVGGFREREFSILCGPTGVGKTAFLANLSANLLCQRVSHFVASVETGQVDFMTRVCSVLVDKDLTTGERLSEEEAKRVESQLDFFFGAAASNCLWLSNIENRISVENLCEMLTFVSERKQCKVAILDNLNFFLEVKSSKDSVVEMDRVIHELIMLCKRIDMHVVMVMHPKKTENGRVESEFDIKGSSTAVQEAHNVFLFNRLTKQDQDIYGPYYRELKAVKMRRRGRNVGRSVMFDGRTPSYKEVVVR